MLELKSVAMEGTGVYWIAPHEVLEKDFEVLLVDTRQLARVPGRNKKTDPSDCEWIQRLHSCGLLNGSFRPQEQVCMLRTLVRDKANLVAESADWVRRMQKSLDQMNVRVHRAVGAWSRRGARASRGSSGARPRSAARARGSGSARGRSSGARCGTSRSPARRGLPC